MIWSSSGKKPVFNRIIHNRKMGKNTWVYVDEIYLLFQHEYSANFLFTLWKRVRKYGACCTGLTQNVDDLLQSHTARTMLANSEFLVMLNQAATDRTELLGCKRPDSVHNLYVYVAYRKAGYSKKFFEGHREAITLHKAAKEAFEQLGLQKLPRVKELNAEYAQLLEQKRAAYPAYRKARAEMQEYLVAQKVAAVLHIPDREPRLHGVLAPPCRKGAPLFHEQF